MNYIEFDTTAAGEAVALKVGVPHADLFTEMAALQLFAGRGAVRLLAADRELGAILMQQAQPGTMLWQLGDNAAETRIAASLMRRLRVPVPAVHAFPSVINQVERAFRLTRSEWDPQERMPRYLLDQAQEALNEIERTKQNDVVLHGDLHHENIVWDERAQWVAIDPKGVIGDPRLEVGRYLQNQLPHDITAAQREAMVRERLHIFSAELEYSQAILAASGLIDCVLSHCWSFEDETLTEDWHYGIELAELLCRIKSE